MIVYLGTEETICGAGSTIKLYMELHHLAVSGRDVTLEVVNVKVGLASLHVVAGSLYLTPTSAPRKGMGNSSNPVWSCTSLLDRIPKDSMYGDGLATKSWRVSIMVSRSRCSASGRAAPWHKARRGRRCNNPMVWLVR